jgi:hypothetical protein
MPRRTASFGEMCAYGTNPGGRPKDELGIRELARSYGAEAIKTLAEIMKEYQRELCGFGGTPERRNGWADRYVTEH